jgi:hypothetical protein
MSTSTDRKRRACPQCGNEFAAAFHCGQCGWSEPVHEISYWPHCGDLLFNSTHKGNVERWCQEARKPARER